MKNPMNRIHDIPLRPLRAATLLALVILSLTSSARAQDCFDSADYELEFVSTWSRETHPENWPSNPHYSGLIGGTHGDGMQFWQVGELASRGVESMAETGSKSRLRSEVQEAVDEGSAGSVLSGPALNDSPDELVWMLSVERQYPLVTLVAMLAPSPDWFVGVSALPMLDEDGAWRNEIVVDLFPYDAGTDSGATYTARDEATEPPEPVRVLETSPFTAGEPIGSFVFRRIVPDLEPTFRRGEVTGEGLVDLSDAVFVLSWLFGGAREPSCLDAADIQDSGEIGIGAPIYLLNFLFLGGPPPPAPFDECGVDTTDDGLPCERPSSECAC